MTQIEAPCRQLAKHGEFRIFVDLFWNIAFAPKGYVSHTFSGTTRIGDIDVFEIDILDRVVRNSTDGSGVDVVEIIYLRSAKVVVDIWTLKRYLCRKVGNAYVSDGTFPIARTQTSSMMAPSTLSIARAERKVSNTRMPLMLILRNPPYEAVPNLRVCC